MAYDKKDMTGLNNRDKELTAIGAAIASNCVPCIEYHIPQARRAGLSDTEIREAIMLADKVRQVPADKVMQTAVSLLDEQNLTQAENQQGACGCEDAMMHSSPRNVDGTGNQGLNNLKLETDKSRKDNEMNQGSNRNKANSSSDACGTGEAAAGSFNTPGHSDFDLSGMMEMMRRCCPEKAGDLTSMMSKFKGNCCPSNENDNSEDLT